MHSTTNTQLGGLTACRVEVGNALSLLLSLQLRDERTTRGHGGIDASTQGPRWGHLGAARVPRTRRSWATQAAQHSLPRWEASSRAGAGATRGRTGQLAGHRPARGSTVLGSVHDDQPSHRRMEGERLSGSVSQDRPWLRGDLGALRPRLHRTQAHRHAQRLRGRAVLPPSEGSGCR